MLKFNGVLFGLILFTFHSNAVAQGEALFSEINTVLVPVDFSSSCWGDYDNDGDLDILMTGASETDPISIIYRNDGNGDFLDIGAGLTGVSSSAVAWGDYDNDGDLDILITGWSGSDHITEIYNNIGNDQFDKLPLTHLSGVSNGSVAWGDYDNDGDLDLILTGHNGFERITELYRNEKYDTFTLNTDIKLIGMDESMVSWGDYDNDSDLDILMTGQTDSEIKTMLYRNDGNGIITPIMDTNLPDVKTNSGCWGDYDNDGDLDILLVGQTDLNNIAQIYKNDRDDTFSFEDNAKLQGLSNGSAGWGDYDNDGDLDILITGYDSQIYTILYHNDGNGFFSLDTSAHLSGVRFGSSCWGDYDNDGRLDVLVIGRDNSATKIAKIYKNMTTDINTPPEVPRDLRNLVLGSGVLLIWRRADDNETNSRALSYNIRVGSTSNRNSVTSPQADNISGYRRVISIGNAQQRRRWNFVNLLPGTYYWSVQAIDNGFVGSQFASERSFTIPQYAPPPQIELSPTLFYVVLPTNSHISNTATITNTAATGSLDLNWEFSQHDTCHWITKNPEGGYINPGSSQDVEIITYSGSDRGEYECELTLYTNDPSNDSLDIIILMSVVNSNPEITSTPITEATEDVLYAYQVEASDWDGDDLNIHLEQAPSWLEMNEMTWLISGTPREEDVGFDTVTVGVSDKMGGSTRQTFYLTIEAVNDPPKIISTLPVFQFDEDDSFAFTLSDLYQYVEDPDHADSMLTFLIGAGRNVTVTQEFDTIILNGPVNWNGIDTLKCLVSDGELSDSSDIFVDIKPINDIPIFVDWPDTVEFSNLSYYAMILRDYVLDHDLPNDSLSWEFSVSDENLRYQFYPITTGLVFTAPDYEGIVKFYCTVTDDASASIADSFYVKVVDGITKAEDLMSNIPKVYNLGQNYPNPFNGTTMIKYDVPIKSKVLLEVYNALGQKIISLINQDVIAGYYQMVFNANNLPSGIYFYRMEVKDAAGTTQKFHDVKKMILLK